MHTFSHSTTSITHTLTYAAASVSDESQAEEICGYGFINADHLNSSRRYWERAGTIKGNEDGIPLPINITCKSPQMDLLLAVVVI